jgi:hypothetical protein
MGWTTLCRACTHALLTLGGWLLKSAAVGRLLYLLVLVNICCYAICRVVPNSCASPVYKCGRRTESGGCCCARQACCSAVTSGGCWCCQGR